MCRCWRRNCCGSDRRNFSSSPTRGGSTRRQPGEGGAAALHFSPKFSPPCFPSQKLNQSADFFRQSRRTRPCSFPAIPPVPGLLSACFPQAIASLFFEPFGSAKRPRRAAISGTTRDTAKSTKQERIYPDMEYPSTAMVASGSSLPTATTLPRRTQRADKRGRRFEGPRVLTPFAAALYRAGPLHARAGA
jgi:hypothetical protein